MTFAIDWPSGVRNLFSFFEQTASVGDNALSLHCIVGQDAFMGNKPFYVMTFGVFLIPPCLLTVIYAFWRLVAWRQVAWPLPEQLYSQTYLPEVYLLALVVL